ncbi:hypothetical protein SAMN02745866_00489 [Alteromonadaceae bacterium Bs31]|nr:hypothetical protein SAMN02745866_00489 [Alteromonadaceae bacterium Bs31]
MFQIVTGGYYSRDVHLSITTYFARAVNQYHDEKKIKFEREEKQTCR